ncbi:MAG: VWA domain-containing protein [Spirochaetes bacterium]|nr:VWA domain-containing protein [Spirochaetota bacterium]MBU1079932.1 VWA domain-containing protein [Spirochaetota bacterium]
MNGDIAMTTTKRAIAAALMAAAGAGAWAQGISITQIGTERLLSNQETRVYVSAPALGLADGVEPPLFEVWESGDGADWLQRPVSRVSLEPNADEGISFFLLLDNSGSMWTDPAGAEAQDAGGSRIESAKAAARAFLGALSPKDGVGLAVFNTRYWNASPPGGRPADAERVLDEISRPGTEDAFTELFLSLQRGLADFAAEPGRRVLIVLSDGENYPYALKTGKPNPETGIRSASPSDIVDSAVRDGVTVYAIRFGAQRDPLVARIAEETGGRTFDAMDGAELARVYDEIRTDVLSEIAVDYRAGMIPGEKRWVKVAVANAAGGRLSATRHYFAGTVLGRGAGEPRPYYLLFVGAAAAAWLTLVLAKLERETDRAGVRLLYGSQATRFFAIAGPQTVIGAAPDADVSIAGNPSLKASHATILFDEAKNVYTIVADSPVSVNNHNVVRRRLESGDVINMAGTVVVFDEELAKGPKGPKGAEGGKRR